MTFSWCRVFQAIILIALYLKTYFHISVATAAATNVNKLLLIETVGVHFVFFGREQYYSWHDKSKIDQTNETGHAQRSNNYENIWTVPS